MNSIDQRVWEFLPSRQVRARTTGLNVIAANLGLSSADVAQSLERLQRTGSVRVDRRGSWMRGLDPNSPYARRKEPNHAQDPRNQTGGVDR